MSSASKNAPAIERVYFCLEKSNDCQVVNCSELRGGRGVTERVRFPGSPCQVLQETC
jgi:hypothetical protein